MSTAMKTKVSRGAQRPRLRGTVVVEHIRAGKVIGKQEFSNGITDQGMLYLLDAAFHGDAQVTTWYIGLINSLSYTGLSAADTMASHGGWIECTTYGEGMHPQWTCGGAATRAITNAATVDFSLNATKTLKGVYFTSNATKGASSGTLWSTALFVAPIAVNDGDTLKVTYTVTGT